MGGISATITRLLPMGPRHPGGTAWRWGDGRAHYEAELERGRPGLCPGQGKRLRPGQAQLLSRLPDLRARPEDALFSGLAAPDPAIQ